MSPLPLPNVAHDPAQQQVNAAIAAAFPVSGNNLGPPAQNVTSLPTTGLYVGKQVTYKAGAGIYWLLLYTNESTEYPWNKIGGPPLFSEVATSQGTTSGTYGNLATVGPEVSLPLKGDYMVATGAGIYDSGTVLTDAVMSYAIGASEALDADAIEANSFSLPSNVSAVIPGGLSRERRKTGLTAVTLQAKYKSSANSASATAIFYNRWMRVDPVRVG